jgi:hypothetical protein
VVGLHSILAADEPTPDAQALHGRKVLVRRVGELSVIDAAPDQKETAQISNPSDVERQSEGPSAMLGADFRVENGTYRITKLYEGALWDAASRNLLTQAGVKEGDYLLAVNGAPLEMGKDPWAALQKTANTSLKLTVGGKPANVYRRSKLKMTLYPLVQ